MRSLRIRAARALCSTALLTGVITPAFAQTSAPAPEPYRNADENGVDLVTGTFNLAITEGAIGPDAGGVSMVRYYGQSGMRDNWSGDLRKISSGGQTYAVITFGGISERFVLSGGSWVPEKANGATLVESSGGTIFAYLYTAPDGTQIQYTDPIQMQFGGPLDTVHGQFDQCSSGNALQCAVPTAITRPDNVIYNLSWDSARQCPEGSEPGGGIGGDPGSAPCTVTYRFAGAQSNASYSLAVSYASNVDSLPGVGGGTVPPSYQWWERTGVTFDDLSQSGTSGPVVTYTSPSSGVLDITSSQSGTTRITINNTAGAIGIRRPGASSDTTVITRNTTTWKVSSVVSDGRTKSYSWGTSGGSPAVTVTDGASNSETVVTNPTAAQPSAVGNGVGQSVSYTYDSNGRVTRITQPEGNYVEFTRDARGNVTQTLQRAKSGSGLADIVSSANYDASCANAAKCNDPNYVIDPRGNRTDYTYNSAGLLSQVQLPAATSGAVRAQIDYTWSDLYAQVDYGSGLVNAATPQKKLTQIRACATAATCAGTASETVVTLAYNNPNLLLTSATTAAGNGSISSTTSYSYDVRDNLVGIDGPLAGSDDSVTYIYDSLDRRIGEIGPDPDGTGSQLRQALRHTYDTGNRITKTEAGTVTGTTASHLAAMTVYRTVDLAYDANARLTSRTLKGSDGTALSLVQQSYDAAGRLDCTALRMNPAAFGSLPSSACSLGTAGSFGPDRITKMHYDAADRPTRQESGYGTTEVGDDAVLSYTANGAVATAKDGEANLTTYEYDGFDRLAKTRLPVTTKGSNASSTTDYEQYTYDATGNIVTRRTRAAETLGFTYDALGRLIVKTVPERSGLSSTHTRDVYYGYDLLGRPSYARFDSTGGEGLTFAFDALSRMTSTTHAIDGASRTLSYQYDTAGRRTQIAWPDNAQAATSYDALGRPGATSIVGHYSAFGYTYDAQGQLTQQWKGSTSNTFSHDAGGRLTGIGTDISGTSFDTSTSMTHNPAGQIASRTVTNDAYAWPGHTNVDRNYTANGLNQYSAASSVSFSYDANGNLVSDGTTTFTYDVENRLVAASGGNSGSLRYDPLGRLYELTEGSAVTRMLYDGSDLVGEYNTGGAMVRRYVHGSGAGDDPVMYFDGPYVANGYQNYLYTDERGSIIARAAYDGTPAGVNSYDEYGIPASGNAGRFQYTGQAWLAGLGLYHYKARMYSPTLGRFMQTDPIGYADGMNWYNYVGSDPVNAVDPTGLGAWTCFDGNTRLGVVETEADNNTPEGQAEAQAKCNALGSTAQNIGLDGFGAFSNTGLGDYGDGGPWSTPTPGGLAGSTCGLAEALEPIAEAGVDLGLAGALIGMFVTRTPHGAGPGLVFAQHAGIAASGAQLVADATQAESLTDGGLALVRFGVNLAGGKLLSRLAGPWALGPMIDKASQGARNTFLGESTARIASATAWLDPEYGCVSKPLY